MFIHTEKIDTLIEVVETDEIEGCNILCLPIKDSMTVIKDS